ncbi:helix-turn-helix domain-containing protein [Luteibacter anthropi]|uniref:helix-turn-helix domain-containing protein n=1 Tax=Luteibacter anthropi TaxID=564369 RepID=UPI00203237D6|nr:helix-turn-helix transcriptional regulator [Luteibacter anthropi]URX63733.1 helix-turn-helix domain-containing protein [Luteibacter anthropi]
MVEADALVRLGTVIGELRRAKGISQERFADSIGMHRAQYGKIERGLTNVTLTTLIRIAAGLGTTLAALLVDADL